MLGRLKTPAVGSAGNKLSSFRRLPTLNKKLLQIHVSTSKKHLMKKVENNSQYSPYIAISNTEDNVLLSVLFGARE